MDEVAPSYANMVNFAVGPFDCIFSFGRMDPSEPRPEGEPPSIEVVARVFMSLSHAKAMLPLMARQIADYEGKFGEIPSPGFGQFSKE